MRKFVVCLLAFNYLLVSPILSTPCVAEELQDPRAPHRQFSTSELPANARPMTPSELTEAIRHMLIQLAWQQKIILELQRELVWMNGRVEFCEQCIRQFIAVRPPSIDQATVENLIVDIRNAIRDRQQALANIERVLGRIQEGIDELIAKLGEKPQPLADATPEPGNSTNQQSGIQKPIDPSKLPIDSRPSMRVIQVPDSLGRRLGIQVVPCGNHLKIIRIMQGPGGEPLAAARLGLVPGDCLGELNEQEISSASEVLEILARNSRVNLTVGRSGQRLHLHLEFVDQLPEFHVKYLSRADSNMSVTELSPLP